MANSNTSNTSNITTKTDIHKARKADLIAFLADAGVSHSPSITLKQLRELALSHLDDAAPASGKTEYSLEEALAEEGKTLDDIKQNSDSSNSPSSDSPSSNSPDGSDEDSTDEAKPHPSLAQAIKERRDRYQVHVVNGKKSVNNGDAVALALAPLDPDQVVELAERLLFPDEPSGSLAARYSHLNPGQRRMNAGNRIRAAVKKGVITLDEIRDEISTIQPAPAQDAPAQDAPAKSA